MHPTFKRASTYSPRSPSSQVSPQDAKRFKTPMRFQPAGAPSPSRRDLWKQELGLDESDSDDALPLSSDDDDEPEADKKNAKGGHSNVEFEALEIELQRKEKQKEALLLRLKESDDRQTSIRTELERVQQAKRNQLKIMKKTYETHLNEKEESIQCLHELIEEQDNKIIELHSKLVGESSSDVDESSTYRTVKKLVDKLSGIQQEKAHLTASVMKAQDRISRLEEKIDEGRGKFETERESLKNVIRKLEKENTEIKNTGGSIEPSVEVKSTIQNLEKEKQLLLDNIKTMEDELSDHKRKNQDWEHRFESEVSSLRKSIKQTEAKYNDVTSAPPKVVVKTVVPEEKKRRIEELEDIKRKLELNIDELNKKISSQATLFEDSSSSMNSRIQQLNKDIEMKEEEMDKLKSALSEKGQFEELYKQSQSEMCVLDNELKRTSENSTRLQSESSQKIKNLQAELITSVRNAEIEAEKKYSVVIDRYNKTKQMVGDIVSSVINIKDEYWQIKAEMTSLQNMIRPAMTKAHKEITRAIAEIDAKNKVLVTKYKKEMGLRKKFHNQLVELKGNIRVFCRVRPQIKEDGSGVMAENVVSFDEDDDAVLSIDHNNKLREFEMDCVFKPSSTQIEVFNEVQALVTSCIDGYNVCIFAYGQTGSGKTFTMEGTREDPGINQRALAQLFDDIAERSDWVYNLTVSMMEIYNESLRDLLSSTPTAALEVKLNKNSVYVPGLIERDVENVDDVNNVFALGKKNRATAATNMNEHSSRSHAILVINIVGENKNTGTKTIGKLNLVDLAGSERISKSGAEGTRMQEAKKINLSLSALGDVIHSLKNNAGHIPYRNSKLTYLLQDSLGGDSKTLMVVQVAPVKKNAPETFCSLDFAQRVRTVELGAASVNTESTGTPKTSGTPKSVSTPKTKTTKKRI